MRPDDLENLTPEQNQIAEQWRAGQELSHLVSTPGWSRLLEMFGSYREDSVHDLIQTNPGDDSLVLKRHAAAWAIDQNLTKLVEDVQQSVNFHQHHSLTELLIQAAAPQQLTFDTDFSV